MVAISSFQGELGIPLHTGYAAAKHAVNGLLESLEFEVGDQIRFLKVMPGWITGTNLRNSAFRGDGKKLGESARKHSGQAVSVEECSQLIIRAIHRGSRHLFIPGKLKYLAVLKLLTPGLVRKIIVGAVKKQH
jgi:short-subunit dehydrogenase